MTGNRNTQTPTRLLATLVLLSCGPAEQKKNWKGSAHMVLGESMNGTETQASVGGHGQILCEESYALDSVPKTTWSTTVTGCDGCAFAFLLQVSDVEKVDGSWCGRFGRESDGWYGAGEFTLGFDFEENLMLFGDPEIGWRDEPDVDATWTGDDVEGDLTWDWNWSVRYYYEND